MVGVWVFRIAEYSATRTCFEFEASYGRILCYKDMC